MSYSIPSGAAALPVPTTAGVGAQTGAVPVAGATAPGDGVTGAQPLVGGDAAATQAALSPAIQGSLVDAAIARQLDDGVSGGGPGVAVEDPRDGMPGFVRRFLPSAPQEGAAPPTAPPGKGHAPQQCVHQGWAWMRCGIPPHFPPTPDAGPVAPAPPGKGDLPEAPPVPGGPPAKAPSSTPPMKTGPVTQVGDATPQGTHVVRPGEYLSKIAPRFGLTWQELFAANRHQIKNPDLIHPGLVLVIPAPGGKSPVQGPATPPNTPPSKPSTPPSKAPGKPPVVERPPTKGPDVPGRPPSKPPSKPPVADRPPTKQPPVPAKPPTEKPPVKPPVQDKPPVPAKPPAEKPAEKPPVEKPAEKPPVDKPAEKPPVQDKPPVERPPVESGQGTPPAGGDTNATLPAAPPVPDADGLPPALPGN